jgi:hypothetical protein
VEPEVTHDISVVIVLVLRFKMLSGITLNHSCVEWPAVRTVAHDGLFTLHSACNTLERIFECDIYFEFL